MRESVYVSTSSFPTRRLAMIFAVCASYGIDALELSTVEDYDEQLLESSDRPQHLLVHNYFPPPSAPFVLNLASQDAATLERSRTHCRAAIDLSQSLGGSLYAAHAGYTADIPPEVLGRPDRQGTLPTESFATYDRTYATLVESARELASYGDARGVRFLVENHVLPASAGEAGRRLFLMVEAHELERLVSDVGSPSFGLLVDVGHLKVTATTLGFDPQRFLDRLGDHVVGLHLSDNDGSTDRHRPFSDNAWFLPRLRDFPEAAVTVELAGAAVQEILTTRDIVSRWR